MEIEIRMQNSKSAAAKWMDGYGENNDGVIGDLWQQTRLNFYFLCWDDFFSRVDIIIMYVSESECSTAQI